MCSVSNNNGMPLFTLLGHLEPAYLIMDALGLNKIWYELHKYQKTNKHQTNLQIKTRKLSQQHKSQPNYQEQDTLARFGTTITEETINLSKATASVEKKKEKQEEEKEKRKKKKQKGKDEYKH